jgi:hypothetical protein
MHTESSDIRFRSHQLCVFHEYARDVLHHILGTQQFAVLFQMNPPTVRRTLLRGPRQPGPLGRHMAIEDDREADLVTILIFFPFPFLNRSLLDEDFSNLMSEDGLDHPNCIRIASEFAGVLCSVSTMFLTFFSWIFLQFCSTQFELLAARVGLNLERSSTRMLEGMIEKLLFLIIVRKVVFESCFCPFLISSLRS